MRARFTRSFKIQAVEKALSRSTQTSLQEIADSLGVGYSTLGKWISKSRNHELESEHFAMEKKEKRPQDRSLEERLEMVMACASLDEEEKSEYCRKQGVYLHQVNQWKLDFGSEDLSSDTANKRQEMKNLKNENKALRKELNRKDKALAETAALLVLQKKVNAIWGNGEDDSQ